MVRRVGRDARGDLADARRTSITSAESPACCASGRAGALHPADLPLYLRGAEQAADVRRIRSSSRTPPDRELAEGDVLTLGSLAFDVTASARAFARPRSVRDTATSCSAATCCSPVRSAGPTCRSATRVRMEESLMRICELGDETVVHPGHGPSTTIGRERRDESVSHRRRAHRAAMSAWIACPYAPASRPSARHARRSGSARRCFFSAAVAPALFAVLPTRTLAGAVVGRMLPVDLLRRNRVGVALMALQVSGREAVDVWRARGCRRRDGRRVRRRAIHRRPADRAASRRDRRSDGGAGGRRRRAASAFGRLHGISVGWLGLAMIAAVVAIIVARSRVERGRRLARVDVTHFNTEY